MIQEGFYSIFILVECSCDIGELADHMRNTRIQSFCYLVEDFLCHIAHIFLKRSSSMKNLRALSLLILLFASLHLSSQENQFRLPHNEQQSFFEIQQKANEFFDHEYPNMNDRIGDNDYLRFKRWEWYWKDRVMADGSFPDLRAQKRVYDELQSQSGDNRDIDNLWTNIGQTTADGGYHGMGRATSVAFHPTDPDIFYVGAPIGGIWKTTDGGQTYAALGDSLPYVSVGNICVDHQNPDIIYITVGDHNGWWKYGLGVYKSIDGGTTWNASSNVSTFVQGEAYYRMVMNPTNSNEIFVAQTNGLFRTQDGGENWDMVRQDSHIDVIFKPGSATTLYAATDDYWGNSEVYKSEDNGETWEQISDFNESANDLQLTTTPSNPEFIGVQSSISGNTDFYMSDDGGLNLFNISYMPESGVIFYSPTDPNTIYSGSLVVYRSQDSGFQWNQFTDWYDSGDYTEVHADNRYVTYNPLNNVIYFCNDGGVYKFDEPNEEWTELTSGLIITQFYRIAVSQQSDVFMIGGTQDNGGRKRVSMSNWDDTNGGDAMEVAINSSNDQIIYSTYINGLLYRSTDQWEDDDYNEITPDGTTGGAWVTPYVLDPSNQSVIVAGYEDVFRSTNSGNSWSAISDNLTGNPDNKLETIAVAPSDGDVIYTTRGNKLYFTLDGGDTWDDELIYIGGTNDATASSIVVHPLDPLKIWITVSGYATGKKVYYSQDAGVTFSNISYNLPNIPVNASVIDKESEFLDLYIGTDVGVFIFNIATNQWDYYGEGIPNTSVTDLEIQYSSRKLRAGTYGRGIWENDLFSEAYVSVISYDAESQTRIDLLKNPVGETLSLNVHSIQNWKGRLAIYSLDGTLVWAQSKNLPQGNYQVYLTPSNLSSGIYLLNFESSTGNIPALKFVKE